jgi:hypothetical protein
VRGLKTERLGRRHRSCRDDQEHKH